MHVALYSPGWPPQSNPNGIVTYVSHMRRELENQGHKVSLFHGNGPHQPDADQRVHAVRKSGWRRLKSKLSGETPERQVLGHGELLADALLNLHRREAIDVVEMEESFGWCAQVQKRVPFPVVTKLHGPAFLTKPEGAMSAALLSSRLVAEGEALHRASFVTSPTRSTIDLTAAHYGIDLQSAVVIVNPIASETANHSWRPEEANANEVLFVGRFDRHKGGDFLITAFARLLRMRPEVRLVFVGPDSGLFEDDGTKVGIEEFIAKTLSSEERKQVSYLGPMQSDKIAALRCRASVVVVCSRWENQPNTALEAMLQGCPLVSSDAGGMSEIVEHERTGLLYKSEQVDSFCEHVWRVLDDSVLARSIGANGRQYVLKTHSPEAVVRQTLAYYASIK